MFFGVILLKKKYHRSSIFGYFKQFVGDTKRKWSMKKRKRLDSFMLLILKFCTTNDLFKYPRKMHIVIVTENLNKPLKN